MTPNNEVSDLSNLGIHQLSSTEWLVRNQTIDATDPSGLLGIIQSVGAAYEVTKLGVLKQRWYFSTFDAATASFLRHEAPVGSIPAQLRHSMQG